ncbi:alpha/beta fold hydrolase [Paenibacillus arenilitoris]|uniref:Alpha/beta hydrolase n=1 Tax=Paenibacillus arenilitoris TaxID=2772299 RepID=A0A927H5K1_9BACL|nr:alpha/beta hydrolase [Paenibacillus arenilitoris]MBD2868623.1 alpha/beta hydrolase [Paenibacillus arenilitoris]
MPYATINGTELYYESSGSGTPIVFIHPPLLTSANFKYQQAQLSSGCRVVTFDIRGHGRSRPSEAPVTYELIVKDLKQLLNHLGIEKAFVAGYSTGGSIALEALLTYPALFAGGILISAMSEASDFVLRNRIRIAIGLSGWKPAIGLLRLGITWGNADSRATFRNLLNDSKSGNKRNIRQYYKYSLQYRCTERLPEIAAPVLLLYGDKDWGFKRYKKILRQGLPNSKLVIFRTVKHQLPTKAADGLNEAISRFVAEVAKENRKAADEAAGIMEVIQEAYVVDPEFHEERPHH